MSKLLSIIHSLVTIPLYCVVLILDAVIGPSPISDWAAKKIGLQGRGPGAVPPTMGDDGLIGAVGEALEDFKLTECPIKRIGKVRVKGEIWQAEAAAHDAIIRSARVRVTDQAGMILQVERMGTG